jgi:hypothetical protein
MTRRLRGKLDAVVLGGDLVPVTGRDFRQLVAARKRHRWLADLVLDFDAQLLALS